MTIDAIGCQKSIASQIVEQRADYVLAVKENQPSLLADIKDLFQMLAADSVDEEIDCGHGRVERRTCSVLADLSLLDAPGEWASLQGLVRIEAERYHKATGKTEREIRYYITSLKPDAARLNAAIRQHWGIENKLHWVLMSASARTSAANAPDTPRRTIPSSRASPSTCSNRTKPANWASTANACRLLGPRIFAPPTRSPNLDAFALLYDRRMDYDDGAIVEMVLWRVPGAGSSIDPRPQVLALLWLARSSRGWLRQ